jgi:hypothetical protein
VLLLGVEIGEHPLFIDVNWPARGSGYRFKHQCAGTVVAEDDIVGQKEALLLFIISLSHMGLGLLIVFLLATLFGPMALLATVGTDVTRPANIFLPPCVLCLAPFPLLLPLPEPSRVFTRASHSSSVRSS